MDADSAAVSRRAKEKDDIDATAQVINGMTIHFIARAGEKGKLFGSITSGDIVAALQQQFGVELDRRRLGLDEPLKELGSVDLAIRLHADVVATLTVDVVAQ